MPLVVVEPNVLISGLIAQGPPAELVDLIRYREISCVVCEQLLDELEGVLRRPKFRRYVTESEAVDYVQLIRALALAHPNPTDLGGIECRDPADAYLIALARDAEVEALVSGDHDLTDRDDPQPLILTPTKAVDRYDAVPRTPFQAVRGTFQLAFSGPKATERRAHRALHAAGFVAQRMSGGEEHASIAWVQALRHAGQDAVPLELQHEWLERSQAVTAAEGYRLRQHGVVIAGTPEFRIVRDRRSGAEVLRMFASDPHQALASIARQLGLPREDLALEDPPGAWGVPT